MRRLWENGFVRGIAIVALVPWFYAPERGPRRLLWFTGTTAVAGALAIRAYMTGAA